MNRHLFTTLPKLIIAWIAIAFVVLLTSLYGAETKEAASSTAFFMTILSFPSSILAGEVLNANLNLISSPRLFAALVWLAFFIAGLIQWLIVWRVANLFKRD